MILVQLYGKLVRDSTNRQRKKKGGKLDRNYNRNCGGYFMKGLGKISKQKIDEIQYTKIRFNW